MGFEENVTHTEKTVGCSEFFNADRFIVGYRAISGKEPSPHAAKFFVYLSELCGRAYRWGISDRAAGAACKSLDEVVPDTREEDCDFLGSMFAAIYSAYLDGFAGISQWKAQKCGNAEM